MGQATYSYSGAMNYGAGYLFLRWAMNFGAGYLFLRWAMNYGAGYLFLRWAMNYGAACTTTIILPPRRQLKFPT